MHFTSYSELHPHIAFMQSSVRDFYYLEKTIKTASQPDSPTILFCYLQLTESYAKKRTKDLQIQIYTHTLDLLLDVFCDTYLAKHWRELCLNNCYKPLTALNKLAESDAEKKYVRQQYEKFRTLSHYFN